MLSKGQWRRRSVQETCQQEFAGARGGEDVWEMMGKQGTGPGGRGTRHTALGTKHRARSAGMEVGGGTLGAHAHCRPRRETLKKAEPPTGIAENEQ